MTTFISANRVNSIMRHALTLLFTICILANSVMAAGMSCDMSLSGANENTHSAHSNSAFTTANHSDTSYQQVAAEIDDPASCGNCSDSCEATMTCSQCQATCSVSAILAQLTIVTDLKASSLEFEISIVFPSATFSSFLRPPISI